MKKLDRELGLFSVFAISCGAMLGPGLFVLPGLAYLLGGPATILAYTVAGLLAIPGALSISEMATALPESGGPYLFLDRSLGPIAGTLTGLGTWVSLIFKSAFSLIGLGAYLMFFSGLSPAYVKTVALLIGLFLILINTMGGKKAGQVQSILVIVTIFILIDFIGWGGIEVNSGQFHPFFEKGFLGFLGATAFVFVSYAGITKVVSVAEEIKDPDRNIPWGIMLSLIVTILLYTLVAYVVVGVVPPEQLGMGKDKLMPLVQAGRAIGGYWGMEIMAGVAVLALASMANAGLMAASRFPLPMSRDKILPAAFSKINRRFSTPLTSILFSGGLLLCFIYFLPVKSLAKLASTFLLLVFAMVNLALIIFRESEIEWYKPSFNAPGYPFLQIFGFLSCFSLIFLMGWFPVLGAMVLIGVCFAWYFIYARHHTDRIGAFFRKPMADEQEIQLFQSARSTSRTKKGSVIVPFFGLEDANMLEVENRIRLAGSLCEDGERMDVVDFIEVPEQAFLSSYEAGQEAYSALEQRVTLLRSEIDNEMHLDQVVTHHSRGALLNYAEEEKPHWVVFDWQEPSPWRILVGGNKWWLEDFPCDILFYKDRGKLELNSIVVLTQPGPYDGEVVYAADHIASHKGSKITFLNPLAPTKKAFEFVSSYQAELKRMCQVPAESEMIPVDDWIDGVLEHLKDADLLLIGGLTHETFEDFSEKKYVEEIIEESECNVARVLSNLRTPQSVMKKARGEKLDLSYYFKDDSVVLKLDADNKTDLFEKIARDLSETTDVAPEKFEEALLKRERVQNTYIENGVAFPHGILNGVEKTFLKVVLLENSVEYTEDGDRVNLCVVTAGPPDDRQTHLQIIGQMAQLLVEDNVREKLLSTDDPASVLLDAVCKLSEPRE
jgi:amino acid transporter/mannitol/fructose-specific phosphotransferase system IIA component (Ntr-type)